MHHHLSGILFIVLLMIPLIVLLFFRLNLLINKKQNEPYLCVIYAFPNGTFDFILKKNTQTSLIQAWQKIQVHLKQEKAKVRDVLYLHMS